MDNSWFYQEMAASNNPASTPSAPKQQPEKKVRRWIIPTAIAIIVLVFIPLFIILAVGKNNNNNQDQIADNPEQPTEQTGTDTPLSTMEEDIHAYLVSLASDQNYEASFEKNETEYSKPPENFSCDRIIEIPYTDLDIMNLDLDYGFVVIISGKGDAPFTPEGNSILVYGGSLKESTYKTVSVTCPSPSPIASNYATYSGSDIFNNLSSDKHYYIWIDPKYLSSGED